jgi:signal transduction histidine kinase
LYLRLTAVVLGTLSFFGVSVFVLHTLALAQATRPLRAEVLRTAADEIVSRGQLAAPDARRDLVQAAVVSDDGSLLAGERVPRWIRRHRGDRRRGELCNTWGACYALRPWPTPAGPHTLVVYQRPSGSYLAPFTAAFLVGIVLWLLVSAAAGVVLLNALRRADEARGRLLAGLAHDLGTPLTSIRGFAETQLAEPGAAPESTHPWTVVYREALRMQRLVEDMLAVSRLTAGRLVLVPRPYDLRESMEAAAERASLAYCRAPRLSLPAEPVVVAADRDRVDQVLGNLVDNAYRHGHGEVEIALEQEPRRVAILIRDHGDGLSPATQEALFQPYRRGETRAGGSGLGLAVAREIALRHGGQLTLENATGGGCRARFELPREV